jgi:hypothetical protein
MNEIDLTGKPPTREDVDRAIAVIKVAIIKDQIKIVSVSPELAVELPNILRVLQVVQRAYERAAIS